MPCTAAGNWSFTGVTTRYQHILDPVEVGQRQWSDLAIAKAPRPIGNVGD